MVERKWWKGACVEMCHCVQLLLASSWLCKMWVVELLGLQEEVLDWHLAI